MKNQNSSDQKVEEDVEALRKYLHPRNQFFVQPNNSGLGFLVDQSIAKKHNEKLP